MLLRHVNHVAIICSDYEKSKRFYTEILGLTVLSEEFRAERESYKLDLALNGVYLIELFSFPNSPSRLSYPEACGLRHIAFEVEDLDAAVRTLTSRGVSVEPIRSGGQRVTFFRDPDGLPIELVEVREKEKPQ